MTRKECLDAAAGCVLKDRNASYGGPEDSFGLISSLWSAYLGVDVDKVDVAMMMGMLKMARIRGNKGYADGFVDLAGYAACGAECASGKPAPKADEEPKFKSGDRVQFRDEIPSTSEPHWFDGTYVERLPDGGHAVKFGPHDHVIHCSDKEIRLAPKEAEGCEELVQEDGEYRKGDLVEIYCYDPNGNEWQPAVYECIYGDNDDEPENLHVVRLPDGKLHHVASGHLRRAKVEGCEELVQKDEAFDAPQTKEEVLERIRDVNPAIFKGFSE